MNPVPCFWRVRKKEQVGFFWSCLGLPQKKTHPLVILVWPFLWYWLHRWSRIQYLLTYEVQYQCLHTWYPVRKCCFSNTGLLKFLKGVNTWQSHLHWSVLFQSKCSLQLYHSTLLLSQFSIRSCFHLIRCDLCSLSHWGLKHVLWMRLKERRIPKVLRGIVRHTKAEYTKQSR